MWPIIDRRPTSDPGQPQTKKRKCGSQPADQSLFTDVFRSRPLLYSIHCVTQLHASTRGEVLSRTLRLTWDIRDSRRDCRASEDVRSVPDSDASIRSNVRAQKTDYSITRSARASKAGGTSRPSALAKEHYFRLIVSEP